MSQLGIGREELLRPRMSYPKESEKGRAFSIFWVIFNAGSLVGLQFATLENHVEGRSSEV